MLRDTERLGRSGEFVVAAFLSLHSDLVSVVPHGSHADIIAEFDEAMLKFQVKTVTQQRLKYKTKNDKKLKNRRGWCLDMRRSGNTVDRNYHSTIDIFALYIVPLGKLLFEASSDNTSRTFSDRFVAELDSEKMLLDSVQRALNRPKK